MSRCFSAHIFHFSFAFVNEILMLPNAQAKLRGLALSRRAAVSFSLWLGSNFLSCCQCDYIFHTQTIDVRGFDFDKR